MKILHIVPNTGCNAGMTNVVMNYYRHIDRTDLTFDLISLDDRYHDYDEEISLLGGRVYHFRKLDLKKLSRLLKKQGREYAAVHIHPIWGAALYGRIIKRSGIPCIIAHSHSTKYSEKRLSAIRNRLLMPVIRHYATHYFGCSDESLKLFGCRKSNKPEFIIRNAIDTCQYSFDAGIRKRIREELNIPENALVLGQVARFSAEKNHLFTLDLFRSLLIRNPDCLLLLVGDGPLRKDIYERALQMGIINNIIFTGSRNDVGQLLSAMDIFLLPSLFEGVPLSLAEAQSNGLRCLVSDNITRSVDLGGCCYLPVNEGTSSWLNAVEALVLDHGPDFRYVYPDIRQYDINNCARDLESVYRSLI